MSKIKSKLIKDVRGKGLFRSVEIVHDAKVDGNDLAYLLMKHGLVTKGTHKYSLRLAPALVIKEKEVISAAFKIRKGVRELEKLNSQRKNEDKKIFLEKKAEKKAE